MLILLVVAAIGDIAHQAEGVELRIERIDGVHGELELFIGIAAFVAADGRLDVQVAADEQARLDTLARKAAFCGPGDVGVKGAGGYKATACGERQFEEVAARNAFPRRGGRGFVGCHQGAPSAEYAD